jgi:hypothetical protein
MPAPYARDAGFAGERYVSPFLGGLPLYLDIDEPPHEHPVARYLWPGVANDCSLILEPGEEIRARWSMMRPTGVLMNPHGQVLGASLDPYPSSYLREIVGYITTHRVAILGRLHLPNAYREDYSLKLALISPALDDIRSTVRQIRRWRDRRNIAWGLHVRHERLQGIEWGTLSPRPKKRGLFRSRADADQAQQVLQIALKFPFGATSTIGLTHPTDPAAPLSEDLFTTLCRELQAAVAGVRVAERGSTTSEVPGGTLLTRRDTREVQHFEVEGTVPYSLPPTLV